MSEPNLKAFQSAIEVWDRLPKELVELRLIKLDPKYQPRDPMLIEGAVQRLRQQQALAEMVSQLEQFLTASPSNEAEAVWLVPRDGDFMLVDGHHRMEAYRKAKRAVIPAKVYRGSNADRLATLSCRLANVKGSRVQLHSDEIREAFWQTLREISKEGSMTWEELRAAGCSYRNLRSAFGGQPSQGTVSSMVNQLRPVRLEYMPLRGSWPTWKECREWLRDTHSHQESQDDDSYIIERLADQMARKLHRHPSHRRSRIYMRIEELLGDADSPEYVISHSPDDDGPNSDF